MTNIAFFIENMNKEFLNEGIYFILPEDGDISPNPSHINNGFCHPYAVKLKEKLKEKGLDSLVHEKELNGIPHSFIEFQGLFYDSETPNGIKNWEKLPVFLPLKPEPIKEVKRKKGFLGLF